MNKEAKNQAKRRAKVDKYLSRHVVGYHPLGSLSPNQAMKDLRKMRKLLGKS